MDFHNWKTIALLEADERFGIDLELFYSDAELQTYQEDGESPVEFVNWVAEKFNLGEVIHGS